MSKYWQLHLLEMLVITMFEVLAAKSFQNLDSYNCLVFWQLELFEMLPIRIVRTSGNQDSLKCWQVFQNPSNYDLQNQNYTHSPV